MDGPPCCRQSFIIAASSLAESPYVSGRAPWCQPIATASLRTNSCPRCKLEKLKTTSLRPLIRATSNESTSNQLVEWALKSEQTVKPVGSNLRYALPGSKRRQQTITPNPKNRIAAQPLWSPFRIVRAPAATNPAANVMFRRYLRRFGLSVNSVSATIIKLNGKCRKSAR